MALQVRFAQCFEVMVAQLGMLLRQWLSAQPDLLRFQEDDHVTSRAVDDFRFLRRRKTVPLEGFPQKPLLPTERNAALRFGARVTYVPLHRLSGSTFIGCFFFMGRATGVLSVMRK